VTAGFPHHSRPGHYGVVLSEELQQYIVTVASALFPGDEVYPSGEKAHVAHFVAERASEQDAEALATIANRWPAANMEQAKDSLIAMEREDSMLFSYLRELLVHGYYSSRRVLAAMVDRGYTYHGAPQPLGYPVGSELLLPTQQRGSYIPTEEVARVENSGP
jgi:hypothetical protein